MNIHVGDDIRAVHGIFKQVFGVGKNMQKAKSMNLGPAWNHQSKLDQYKQFHEPRASAIRNLPIWHRFVNHGTEAAEQPNSSATKTSQSRCRGTNSNLGPMLKPNSSKRGHILHHSDCEVRAPAHSLSYC